jgi:hypothetical protein
MKWVHRYTQHNAREKEKTKKQHAALYYTVRTAQSPPDPLIIKEKAIYTATRKI